MTEQAALRTAVSNGSPPPAAPEPAGQDATLVPVYLTTGVRTSGGNGPGEVQVPPDEGAWLIGEGLAIAGQHPPTGYLGPFQHVVDQS
jgi:hypothetical protein